MPQFIISDTPVTFPFEPYPLQRDYMAKVIECVNNSTNGVLESPTGTGKTLSLLCSTLGWITMKKAEISRNNQSKLTDDASVPKVIYASRTHSQLAQAMQELKRTSYNGMKAVIMGSRDQLCIHPNIMKETSNYAKIHMCNEAVGKGSCSFYHNVESTKESPQLRGATVLDIEDLIAAGQKHKCCPYFLSKEMIQSADIIFMPYNYLIDPMTRNAGQVPLSNSIVIVDEAHNMEKMLEDSFSMKLTSSEIAGCIDDITHIMKTKPESVQAFFQLMKKSEGQETDTAFTTSNLAKLKEDLLNLQESINAINIINTKEGTTFPGSYIFELLDAANITSANFHTKTELLESIVSSVLSDKTGFFRRGAGLLKVLQMLNIVFAVSTEEYKEHVARCFKVHVDIEQQKPTNKSAKIVNFWCFSPNFGMQQLLRKKTRSIILTSGTLAPLKPLISELGLPVSVRLENPHIVTSSQVCVKVVSYGPDKEPLLSNYDNRDNPKYLSSLGRTILSLCPVIPNGVLVFFPSYVMLNKCRDSWEASGIWNQIQRIKAIFVEPQGKEAFDKTMTGYYEKINDPTLKGAIFLAVCRGKVSEGLDFIDINGRAVIITGLPFPPLKDPKVILKKKYLEENRTLQNEMLTGVEWYSLEASRAVNQCIGRIIRHKNDYGAIILCDQRFDQERQKSQLSSWIQGHLGTPPSFGQLITDVKRFFRNAEQSLPRAQLKSQLPSYIESTSSVFGAQRSSDVMSNSNTIVYSSRPNELISQVEIIVQNASGLNNQVKVPNASDLISGPNNQVKHQPNFNDISNYTSPVGLVTLHNRKRSSSKKNEASPEHLISPAKKGKFEITEELPPNTAIEPTSPDSIKDLLALLRSLLSPPTYKLLRDSLAGYQKNRNFEKLTAVLGNIFQDKSLHYLFKGMKRFFLPVHKERFDKYILNNVS